MSIEFRRNIVLSEVPVPGTYRYRNLFQLLPPPDNAPLPVAALGEHPCVVEFTFTPATPAQIISDGHGYPKWVIDNQIATQTIREILFLLTSITSRRLFPGFSSHQTWFLSLGSKGKEKHPAESEWGQEMYACDGFDQKIKGFTKSSCKAIAQVDPKVYFNSDINFGAALDLPTNITALLDCYYTLPRQARRSVLSSCSLVDQGMRLWSEHPSLSFAAFVSALETLIVYDHRNARVKNCETCGQPRYQVNKKFRDFLSLYGSPSREFTKRADEVYRYRSKILHRGELFLGEIEPRDHSARDMEDIELRRHIVRTCRICIVNWLITNAKHKA